MDKTSGVKTQDITSVQNAGNLTTPDESRIRELDEICTRANALQDATILRAAGNELLAMADTSEQHTFGDESGTKTTALLRAKATRILGLAELYQSNFAEAIENFTTSLKICEEYEYKEGVSSAMGNIATVFSAQGDYPQALEYYQRALALDEESKNKHGIAKNTGNIGNVYLALVDYARALEYYQRALAFDEELGNTSGAATNMGNIGTLYSDLADYVPALDYYLRALSLAEKLGSKAGVATHTGNIGTLYFSLADYDRALEYYNKALALDEEIGNKSNVAMWTGNIGIALLKKHETHTALEHLQRAVTITDHIGDKRLTAYWLAGIGSSLRELGRNQEALDYMLRALQLRRNDLQSNEGVAENLVSIGSLLIEQSRLDEATEYLSNGLALAEELGEKKAQYEAHRDLAVINKKRQKWREFALHFEKFHSIEKEVQSEDAKKATQRLDIEKERSEARATKRLLYKTLPSAIADRVLRGEKNISDRFECASILFADVVGFTAIAATMPTATILAFMNFIFAHFDTLAEKHGCERIKTMGDGYLAVCGAPVEREDHAQRLAAMALDMMENIELPDSIRRYLPARTLFHVRIGLHCGELTAGVIGTGKLAYDIYGDAVNTAARMESYGEAGRIQMSEEFVNALSLMQPAHSHLPWVRDGMKAVSRGMINIKGKGFMRTYFLERG